MKLGVVQDDIVIGDLLGVFKGCSVPVILRELSESGGCVFMGERYLHDFIDSPALHDG